MELPSRNKKLVLSLLCGSALFDIGFIVFALVTKRILLVWLFVILAPPLILGLYYWWNVDERTELAAKSASQDSISIFLLLLFGTGIGFLIYGMLNNFDYWEVTSTLLISGFVLLFLQTIMAVVYELRM